jgi:IPT/TIG domain-containing protein
VRVVQEHSTVRRILWLLGSDTPGGSLRSLGDPRELRALADMLAAPPHRFRHREAAGPFLESLHPYGIVVLDAEAASRGAVTRQEVIDYVARGGGLLFLGRHLGNDEARPLTQWLSPAGVELNTGERVDGVFGDDVVGNVCKRWANFRIDDGCFLRVDGPGGGLVPGGTEPGQAVFAARDYGIGRVALLASPTPLTSSALVGEANRGFAADLFRWLGRAGKEAGDADGDGLPDWAEDRNRNNTVDRGETDRFAADSDGDGIPDALEDRNYSGQRDEGETDPLNPDTDKDGTLDGADVRPLWAGKTGSAEATSEPGASAPVVKSAEPAEGPAEGGTRVVLKGEDFHRDCTVWFGTRRSPKVRALGTTTLIVEAPPGEDGADGAIDIRVERPLDGKPGILVEGFRYTARSTARLRLEQGADRTLTLHLDSDAGCAVGFVTCFLESVPPEAVHWESVEAGAAATRAKRRVNFRPHPIAGIWIGLSAGQRSLAGTEVAVVRWTPAGDDQTEAIQFRVSRVRVAAPNGEPLDVPQDDPE